MQSGALRIPVGWRLFFLLHYYEHPYKTSDSIGIGRRGRRRKQLLHDVKEKRGYWNLKEEAPDLNLWGTGCRRDQEPVLRQTAEEMKCIVTSTKTFWPSSFRHIDFQHKRTNNPHSLALEVSTQTVTQTYNVQYVPYFPQARVLK
jgi:hypothetical protein